MADFTIFDYLQLQQDETAFYELMDKETTLEVDENPDNSSVEFILNYSKTISIRPSKNIGSIECLLN